MATQPIVSPEVSMPAMSGGNIEDRMADKLSSAMQSDPEPSQAEPEPAAAAEPDIAETSETADTSEESAVATAPAGTEADTEPDPYADEDDANPAAIEEFLKTPRGREIFAGHKFVRELAKPTAEGGIGHAPSVQDVRQYFLSHRAASQMYADYNSGDPRRMGQFLAHWFGPNPQTGQLTPSSMTALQSLEPTLAQFGPEAYGSIAAPIMSRYEAALIDKGRSSTDPTLKQAIYHAVQVLHYDTHGEYLPKEILNANAQAAQPQVDQERQQLQDGWQQLNSARMQAQRESEGRWIGKLQESEAAALSTQIDKALKPLQEMREKTPELYESLKERYANQVRQAVMADQEVWNLHLMRVDQARRTGNPALIEQVSKSYENLMIPVIASKRKAFLQGAGVVIRQQSDDKHAQLRRIASHTAPSNTGSPVKRSIAPASARKPGESNESYRERRVVEALMA